MPADGEAHVVVERILEKHPSNGGFNRFKDAVFSAIILGAGLIIWEQQDRMARIEQDVAVLKVKCTNKPVERGASD